MQKGNPKCNTVNLPFVCFWWKPLQFCPQHKPHTPQSSPEDQTTHTPTIQTTQLTVAMLGTTLKNFSQMNQCQYFFFFKHDTYSISYFCQTSKLWGYKYANIGCQAVGRGTQRHAQTHICMASFFHFPSNKSTLEVLLGPALFQKTLVAQGCQFVTEPKTMQMENKHLTTHPHTCACGWKIGHSRHVTSDIPSTLSLVSLRGLSGLLRALPNIAESSSPCRRELFPMSPRALPVLLRALPLCHWASWWWC